METELAFEELRLEPGATAEEIRKAHRTRARECHPDVEGDDASMQRLNEARDVALRSVGDMQAASGQEVVLNRILDLEVRREEREAAQQKGRELVAAAATIKIGRLRALQRRASTIALLTGLVAAMLALLRFVGPGASSGLDSLLLLLAASAVGFGAYRTLLVETINQIQFAIDEVGSGLAQRSVFASAFRSIAEGVLNKDLFQERDLERTVQMWSHLGAERERLAWAWVAEGERIVESLDELDSFDGTGLLKQDGGPEGPSLVTLVDVVAWGRAAGIADIDDRLTALVVSGALICFRSRKGLCVSATQIVELARGRGRTPHVSAEEFLDAVKQICGDWMILRRQASSRDRFPPPMRRLRLALERMRSARGDDSIEKKLARLVDRIGYVDFASLMIGKGLENRLLAEHESIDSRGELLTTYRFGLEAKEGG